MSLNKDNLLFTLVGILLGFISAYFLFEAMAARQPPRLGTAGAPVGAAPPTGQPAGPQQGAPAAGGGPAMAEIEALQRRLQENPNDTDAIRTLANLNFDIQNWPRAQELYTRYLELQPGDPGVMTDLGVVHLQQGNIQAALSVFRQVHQIAPDHWESYFNEVIALGSLGQWNEANQVLSRLEELQPDNPRVQQLAADVRQRSGGAS